MDRERGTQKIAEGRLLGGLWAMADCWHRPEAADPHLFLRWKPEAEAGPTGGGLTLRPGVLGGIWSLRCACCIRKP